MTIIEVVPDPLVVDDLPRYFSNDAMFATAIRCVCIHEVPPHVPDFGAVAIYGLGIVGASLAAFGLGQMRRIRRRYP